MKKILFIAHRCGGVDIHENRIETIRNILTDEHIDALEADIRKTKDNVLVLHHDRGVYINGQRVWIESVAYSEIKFLGIPTLEEVFTLLESSNKILDIDIKDEKILPELIHFFKKNKYKKKIFFSCFSLNVLLELQEEVPNGEYFLTLHPKDSFDFSRRFVVRIFLLMLAMFFNKFVIYFLKKRVRRSKIDGVSIPYQVAKKNFIDDLRVFGFKVFVWGTDDEETITNLLTTDIDGIKSRNIKLFHKLYPSS